MPFKDLTRFKINGRNQVTLLHLNCPKVSVVSVESVLGQFHFLGQFKFTESPELRQLSLSSSSPIMIV